MKTLSPLRDTSRPKTTPGRGLAVLTLMSISACFYLPAHVSAQVTKPASEQTSKSMPVARLQRLITEKSEEIRAEREQLKPLAEYRALVEERKGASVKLTLRPGVIENIQKGKKLLQEMEQSRGKVDRRDERISQLESVFMGLPDNVSDAVQGATVNLPRSTNSIISRITDSIGTASVKDQEFVQDALKKLLHTLGVSDTDEAPATTPAKTAVAEMTWESLKKEIEDAQKELTTIESELPKALEAYKTSIAAFYSALATALDAEIAGRGAKIKSFGDDRDQLEHDLDKTGQKEDALNIKLVYAVYGMVLAIVTLFLLLRFFPKELAHSIVVERTMIELLSMGFLLLTVIILGTGKLIGAETLGALLGTIAGYIFGQKQGERRGASEEREKMANLLRTNATESLPRE
jgi:hypothetical protein